MKSKLSSIEILKWELESCFKDLFNTIENLSIEQAQRKPSDKSRTLSVIRNWNANGDKWVKKQDLDKLYTIEYLVLHIAQCKLMYNDYAFGKGSLIWSQLECPEWPKTIFYLNNCQQGLMKSVRNLSSEDLERLVKTNWGEKWQVKKILFTLIQHDSYHLGQINVLKNI